MQSAFGTKGGAEMTMCWLAKVSVEVRLFSLLSLIQNSLIHECLLLSMHRLYNHQSIKNIIKFLYVGILSTENLLKGTSSCEKD